MSIRQMGSALAGAALLLTAAADASVLSDWSLIVLNNVNSTSEVEGRAAIGGSLSGPASNYGIHLSPAANYVNTDVLLVGGNITSQNINMNAGRLRLGGTANGVNINHNGGGTTISDGTTQAQVAALHAQAQGISTFLGGMAATSNVVLPGPGDQPTGVTFTAVPGPGGVAVFNIAASQLFGNNKVQSINLNNVAGATSIIINVTGSSTNWAAGNFVGNFNSAFARSNVLWNFTTASAITWNGGNTMNGAVLAPNADMEFNGTMEGSVVVKSLIQRGEVHLPTYQGYVPAPGALTLLGAAGLVATRRRRG